MNVMTLEILESRIGDDLLENLLQFIMVGGDDVVRTIHGRLPGVANARHHLVGSKSGRGEVAVK